MKIFRNVTKTISEEDGMECDICGYQEKGGKEYTGIWWQISGIEKKAHELYSDKLDLEESENYSEERFDYFFDVCQDCMLKILNSFPLKNKGS